MTVKEKVTLIKQATKLTTLGLTVEKLREKLRKLVEQKTPYDSSQMKIALAEFQVADEEWKRLEQEYLKFREELGEENKSN